MRLADNQAICGFHPMADERDQHLHGFTLLAPEGTDVRGIRIVQWGEVSGKPIRTFMPREKMATVYHADRYILVRRDYRGRGGLMPNATGPVGR